MLERPFSDIETITKGAVPDLPNPNSAMSFCCEAGCVECVCFVCNEKAQICFGTIPVSRDPVMQWYHVCSCEMKLTLACEFSGAPAAFWRYAEIQEGT